jgi:hypothetical protein
MNILDEINLLFDRALLFGGLLAILGYPLYFFARGIGKLKKPQKGGRKQNDIVDLMQQTVILLAVTIFVGGIWALPEIISWFEFKVKLPATSTRLGEVALALFLLARHFGHEYGERRWFYSALGHIAVVGVGFFAGNWLGVFFISVPILTAYYITLYNLALVVLPASDPEDRVERRMRFNILTSYAWGIQSPLIVAASHAWKEPETRVPGDFTWDFSDFPMPIIEKLKWRPGLIWTPAHQVVAITVGTKFKRVDGPGVVFTSAMERPDQVFDLRLQIRSNEIAVISKDGINFKVRVFMAFRLDPDTWSKELYDQLRPLNSILRGADIPSHTKGSFHYSPQRVQAALGVTGTKAAANNAMIYWDQWALNVVEDQARKIISQKNLDEMWRPSEDAKLANALDAIAKELKEVAEPTLRAAGILLAASRVVNFNFLNGDEKADEILKQQLTTWGSEWERERTQILSEAGAKAEHAQQEARAYAASILLNSIADGLQKTELIDSKLPRYVIAMHFLSSLQDYVHKQPDEKLAAELQNHFINWQQQFFPDTDHKEK